MRFHDELRERLGSDRPCWAGARLALPDVVVEVEEAEGRFCARVIVPSDQMSFHWVEVRGLGLSALAELLADWEQGPEAALEAWFKASPPDSSRWRDGGKKKPTVTTVIEAEGGVSADDLGL